MRDYLYSFMQRVERVARRRGEQVARNMLELLTTQCDAFYTSLLKQGSVDHESLRRIIDLILELSSRYDERISLSWAKELTLL